MRRCFSGRSGREPSVLWCSPSDKLSLVSSHAAHLTLFFAERTCAVNQLHRRNSRQCWLLNQLKLHRTERKNPPRCDGRCLRSGAAAIASQRSLAPRAWLARGGCGPLLLAKEGSAEGATWRGLHGAKQTAWAGGHSRAGGSSKSGGPLSCGAWEQVHHDMRQLALLDLP